MLLGGGAIFASVQTLYSTNAAPILISALLMNVQGNSVAVTMQQIPSSVTFIFLDFSNLFVFKSSTYRIFSPVSVNIGGGAVLANLSPGNIQFNYCLLVNNGIVFSHPPFSDYQLEQSIRACGGAACIPLASMTSISNVEVNGNSIVQFIMGGVISLDNVCFTVGYFRCSSIHRFLFFF